MKDGQKPQRSELRAGGPGSGSHAPGSFRGSSTGKKAMNESAYYAGEFSDTDLNTLADAGEFYLDESGFFLMPTQKEMQQLAEMGNRLLLMDWFRLL